MYSHIQYEYGQQYHAELLRKAAQSQLAGAASKRENRAIGLFFTAARSALVGAFSILAKFSEAIRQSRSGELACQIC